MGVVLDLLAIDRIYQAPCPIHHEILYHVAQTTNSQSIVDLKRYIQQHSVFELEQKANRIVPFDQYTEIKFEKPQHTSVYAVVRDYIDNGLGEGHAWNQRAIWLARKLQEPKHFKSIWQTRLQNHQLDPKILFDLYNQAIKKKFMPEQVMTDLHMQKQNKFQEAIFYTLNIFIKQAKVRKNFIHFQCRFDKNGQPMIEFNMDKFKDGLGRLQPDDAVGVFENYPINLHSKSREIKLSFIDRRSNKNITLVVVFGLILKGVQEDIFW